LLVAAGDAVALGEALRSVLTDAALRRTLGTGAARAGAALPDWAETVRCWTAAFDYLVGEQAAEGFP
jgi:hypothetical protein